MGNHKMQLAILENGQPVTTSLLISEGTGNEHKSVIQLIRTYREDLEDFGLLTFQMRPRLEGQHGGADVEYAVLNEQQATLILTYMRNNEIVRAFKKALVKAFYDLKNGQTKQLTASEMFLQNAQILVDLERKQNEQAQQLLKIQSEVKQVAATQLLTSRPQNAESITHLRPRAAKQFGLPERIVEYIIRQTPYAPKPAGMVRNDNEKADGATYAVYWVKDINDVMKRFVKECTKVSAAYATHPLIEGKFKFSGDTK